MFCYQCEQTSQMTGCSSFGVCGKDPETAALQDLLVHALKNCISTYAHAAGQLGERNSEVDAFALEALFTTVTNVNFDTKRMQTMLKRAKQVSALAEETYQAACKKSGKAPAIPARTCSAVDMDDINALIRAGEGVGIEKQIATLGKDITGLQELLVYGVKGLAAYAHHALVLGKTDDKVFAFIHEAMSFLASNPADINALLGLCLKCGEVNLAVMALLDSANTGTYGDPVPTPVRTTPLKGKAILVSGHDLKDLGELLKQTEGKGVLVYTHGEMLPAHGYPELKKYAHLAGHYGGAWQDQREDFDEFPGSILMTTNCIQKPKETYQNRIFTSGMVAWPGLQHLENKDFSPLIKAALEAPGFAQDGENKTILVGFAHKAVLGVADKVIDAVKQGKIKHFFLIGGCDGAKTGRNYFTDFATSAPKDTVILTLGCGKFRFNKLDFGDIDGIPRLLDCGQCNDAFSAIQIAVALSKAFNCGVNDLPLSLIVSWYEQKAVAVLLTLLYLGIKNVRLGPTLPAFVSPAVLKVLVEQFSVKAISTVEEDMKKCLLRA